MTMRPPIQHLRLESPVVAFPAVLQAEFPSIAVARAAELAPAGVLIEERAWCSAASFRAFDDAIEASSSDALTIRGHDAATAACEVLTRFQRFVDRRNDASRAPVFDAVLAAHRALHDESKPLVKADLDHALDTWQWLLRLAPNAPLAVQLAALFHDVERLESEADRRVEQHAPDYQAFKDAHARRGADRAYEVLVLAGVDPEDAARTRAIIASHERRGANDDVDLLNDADALSFFSLNSPGYADYFGPEQTEKKVAYTFARLGSRGKKKLAAVRLRSDVRRSLVRTLAQ